MIVFKQKQQSTKATQTIFKLKSAGNKVAQAINKSAGKTKIQLTRESIQTREALKPANLKGKLISAALDTTNKIEGAVLRPGHAVNKGIEVATTKPAFATTYAIWLGKIPYVPGTTAAATATELVAQKIPAYKKITNITGKIGKAWRKTGISKRLDNITGYDVNRIAGMIPLH